MNDTQRDKTGQNRDIRDIQDTGTLAGTVPLRARAPSLREGCPVCPGTEDNRDTGQLSGQHGRDIGTPGHLGPGVPLSRPAPLDRWQAGFLANVAKAKARGVEPSEKQAAIVKKLRKQNPEAADAVLRGERVEGAPRMDARFAGWLAAMPGPSEPDAEALNRQAEQRELMRVAAQRVLDNAKSGRMVFAETLAWAEHVVATTPPLNRPLGSGEPAAGCTICGSPHHTRSHCPLATEDLL